MKKTILTSALLAMAGVGLMAGSALATPISGDVSMTGTYKAVDSLWQPTTLDQATGIDFLAWTNGAADNTFLVNAGTGTFASLPGIYPNLTIGTINNFQFSPALTLSSGNTLWSAGNFSFAMTSLSVTTQNSTALSITGYGTISCSGYDNTDGTWYFTSQAPGSGSFTWSSTTVPEPATMLLFGTGLIGLGGAVRRRMK